MKQIIRIDKALSFEELQKEVERGGKFIVFPYAISLIVFTLPYFSPAIFVKKGESIRKYKWRYNLISALFGWWGFPLGPMETIHNLRVTSCGGVDLTEEIMLNVDEENFPTHEIEMLLTNQYYSKPDKWDRKEFIKALEPVYERDDTIRKLVIGYTINLPEDVIPYYTVGLKCEKDFGRHTELCRKAIYTRFKETVYFKFLNLNPEDDEQGMCHFLEQQGETILDR